jgi:hypothetical protein
MSDYSQIVAYGPKDGLTSGDPLKRIRGVEIDAELDAISTAIASKLNSSALSDNAGILADLRALTTPAGDRILFLKSSSGDTEFLEVGSGLAVTGNTLSATVGGSGDALTSQPLSQFAATTSAQLAGVISNETGTGSLVFANGPTLIAPVLNTPASGNLSNCTSLPVSTGISGLAAGIATFLATPSSANLAAAVTNETGTGALVFANSPTFITPALGTPSSGDLQNCTGLNAVELTKYKDASEGVTASTTPQIDDDLFGYSLDAASFYRIEGLLVVTAASTAPDITLQLNTTSAFTASGWRATAHFGTSTPDNNTATDVTTAMTVQCQNGTVFISVEGYIIVNGAATVDLYWAQNVASGTTTIEAGSWLRLTKMN